MRIGLLGILLFSLLIGDRASAQAALYRCLSPLNLGDGSSHLIIRDGSTAYLVEDDRYIDQILMVPNFESSRKGEKSDDPMPDYFTVRDGGWQRIFRTDGSLKTADEVQFEGHVRPPLLVGARVSMNRDIAKAVMNLMEQHYRNRKERPNAKVLSSCLKDVRELRPFLPKDWQSIAPLEKSTERPDSRILLDAPKCGQSCGQK